MYFCTSTLIQLYICVYYKQIKHNNLKIEEMKTSLFIELNKKQIGYIKKISLTKEFLRVQILAPFTLPVGSGAWKDSEETILKEGTLYIKKIDKDDVFIESRRAGMLFSTIISMKKYTEIKKFLVPLDVHSQKIKNI